MEGASQENRDAAGEEGVREVPTGLSAAGHDQAELRARHILQQLCPRLRVLRILLEINICACHLDTTSNFNPRSDPNRRTHRIKD